MERKELISPMHTSPHLVSVLTFTQLETWILIKKLKLAKGIWVMAAGLQINYKIIALGHWKHAWLGNHEHQKPFWLKSVWPSYRPWRWGRQTQERRWGQKDRGHLVPEGSPPELSSYLHLVPCTSDHAIPFLPKRTGTIFRKFKNHSQRNKKPVLRFPFSVPWRGLHLPSCPHQTRDTGLPRILFLFSTASAAASKHLWVFKRDAKGRNDVGLRKQCINQSQRSLLATRKSNCVCEKDSVENRLEGLRTREDKDRQPWKKLMGGRQGPVKQPEFTKSLALPRDRPMFQPLMPVPAWIMQCSPRYISSRLHVAVAVRLRISLRGKVIAETSHSIHDAHTRRALFIPLLKAYTSLPPCLCFCCVAFETSPLSYFYHCFSPLAWSCWVFPVWGKW